MIFVSDPVSWLGDLETSSAELLPLVEEAKMRGIILVPVGIGEYAELTGLTTIASTEMTAFHFGDYESPRTLGKAIIQGKRSSFSWVRGVTEKGALLKMEVHLRSWES